MKAAPRYPIYIPSKGRAQYKYCLTPRVFDRDGVPFRVVVEPSEFDLYASQFGEERCLRLPADNYTLLGARNWIWNHAKEAGAPRFWMFDDNIAGVYRRFKAYRILVDPNIAIRVAEDFADRYENIACLGFNYMMFAPDWQDMPPFRINVHVYSSQLIDVAVPYRFRLVYNDDTDFCLQVLSSGWWTTVLLNAFLIQKIRTMILKGGNTDALYQGDGRLRMARQLERVWPGVVETKRRFQRPQHAIKNQWKKFDQPLILKPGVNLKGLKPNNYGMRLVKRAEPQSPFIKRLLAEEEKRNGKA